MWRYVSINLTARVECIFKHSNFPLFTSFEFLMILVISKKHTLFGKQFPWSVIFWKTSFTWIIIHGILSLYIYNLQAKPGNVLFQTNFSSSFFFVWEAQPMMLDNSASFVLRQLLSSRFYQAHCSESCFPLLSGD